MIYIAALLTVFNRKEATINCLRKLYAQDLVGSSEIQMDVYLTDDGCTDGTTDEVIKYFPNVTIIKGDNNLFWNRGMWTSWKVASDNRDYDFYLWLNDDVDLFVYSLDLLLNDSKLLDDKGIVVGATHSTTGDQLTYGGRKNGIIPPCDGQPNEIDYFNGNIVLISKHVFHLVGNLDYYFTHSKGDFDYGLRAKALGVKMIQCGSPLGICDAHRSISKWCNPAIPLKERWKLMHKPNGMPPLESFHLNYRHFGLLSAIKVYILIHIRCLIPIIWVKYRK